MKTCSAYCNIHMYVCIICIYVCAACCMFTHMPQMFGKCLLSKNNDWHAAWSGQHAVPWPTHSQLLSACVCVCVCVCCCCKLYLCAYDNIAYMKICLKHNIIISQFRVEQNTTAASSRLSFVFGQASLGDCRSYNYSYTYSYSYG